MSKINWEGVLERLVEETGAKNPRELDDKVDVPTNYSYQISKRGMSKGYLEKVLEHFGDIDLNYVIKGERTIPQEDTIQKLILNTNSNNKLALLITSELKGPKNKHKGQPTNEEYYQEILNFIQKLISASLGK